MRILIVEDDDTTAQFVRRSLREAGHDAWVASDGEAGLRQARSAAPDVIVLDRTLPGLDGMDVLRALRETETGRPTPVLFLTALGSLDERVEGLLAGGDDYLTKPFHAVELLARVTALARRPARDDAPCLRVADLEVDLLNRQVNRAGHQIHLKPKEFALLVELLRHKGEVLTKTMLLERVWRYHFDPGTTVVETHVSRLRAAVDKPFALALIQTVKPRDALSDTGYVIRAP